MAKLVAIAAALLVLAAGARAVTVVEFLTDPKFKPFVAKAPGSCLSDPAVQANPPLFDLDLCPSLISLLDVYAATQSVTGVQVECEPSCEKTFYTLGDQCRTELTQNFNADPTDLSQLVSNVLADCATLHANPGGFASPPMAEPPAIAPSPEDIGPLPSPI